MAAKKIKARGYRLPPGPRGDDPGGGRGGQGQGRTGDMRYANQYRETIRRNPEAPFGRTADGVPLPSVVPTTIRGGERVPIPNARRSKPRVLRSPKPSTLRYWNRRNA